MVRPLVANVPRANQHYIPGQVCEAVDELRESHRIWVQEGLKSKYNIRESKWTESVAVGSRDFVEEMKDQLGFKIKGRKIVESIEACELRESPLSTYHNDCADKVKYLRQSRRYLTR